DHQRVAVLVDQLVVVATAAAMVAEESKGDGVENGRLARAVEPGQHPQGGRAVEVDGLLVLVAQKTLEPDATRNHAGTSPGRDPSGSVARVPEHLLLLSHKDGLGGKPSRRKPPEGASRGSQCDFGSEPGWP